MANVPKDVTIECDQPTPKDKPTATDNCDPNVLVSVNETTAPGNCPQAKVITRTFTAIDNCGNTTTAVQKVTVQDTKPPSLTFNNPLFNGLVEGDTVKLQCGKEVVFTEDDFIAIDNCDPHPKFKMVDIIIVNTPCEKLLKCIATECDACGNATTLVFYVKISDTMAPVINNCPGDLVLDCTQTIPAAPKLTATDNCDFDVQVFFDEKTSNGPCPQSKTITRTWTAVDDCGNISTCTQTIKVEDKTAPVISINKPGFVNNGEITVECGTIVPELTKADVTATDNCDAKVDINVNEVSEQGNCFTDGYLTKYIYTVTATDDCGNVATFKFTIKVKDTTAPILSQAPANITINCGENIPTAATLTATDNCDQNVSVTIKENTVSGNCTGNYKIVRTWTASDDCGNTATISQTITVQDNTAPVFASVPSDVTISCDVPLPTAPNLIVTDKCDPNAGVITFKEIKTTGPCPQAYVLTRVWTASDNCGNTAVATQNITVQDTQAPIIVGVPADITIECDQPIPTNNVKAADNCDPNPTLTFTEDKVLGSCKQSYTLIRTWTATDACGNQNVKTQKISVVDSKAPVFTQVPVSVTIECSDPIPGLGLDVNATDNCDQKVYISFHDTTTPGNCENAYTITRIFTATDACGNTSTAIQTITVKDTKAPVIGNVPADITLECSDPVPAVANVFASDNCDDQVTVTHTDVTSGNSCLKVVVRTYTATDNCGNTATKVQKITFKDTKPPVAMPMGPLAGVPNGTTLTVNCDDALAMDENSVKFKDDCDPNVPTVFTEKATIGDCLKDGFILLLECTWTGTDDCGNSASYTVYFKIVDTKAPVITNCPQDITIECTDVIPGVANVTASDNCDKDVQISINEKIIAGPCPQSKIIERTYTATDDCGNTATCKQKITVQDTQAPIIVGVPADITIECDQPIPTNNVKAADNCDPNPTLTFTEDKVLGSCKQSYTLIRTWTATDACGNQNVKTQKISVVDSKAPVFTQVPVSVTIECSDPIPGLGLDVNATDNCDQKVYISFHDTTTPGNCENAYTITRIFTATDACGNTSTAIQTITVKDTKAPVIGNVPADITLECSDPVPAVANVFASDNCDDQVTVTHTDVTSGNSCLKVVVRTYTATDNCGNTATKVQKITFKDTKPPVAMPMGPLAGVPNGTTLTVNCDDALAMDENSVKFKDDCDPNVPTVFTEKATIGDCLKDGFILLLECTWTGTDDCGNSASYTVYFKIVDTKAPVITNCPQDITIECTDVIPGVANVTASDNCDKDVQISINEKIIAGPCPQSKIIERTYTATDDCGNTATCKQKITVQDTKAPILVGVPANITVECNAIPQVPNINTIKGADDCDTHPTITYDETVETGKCPYKIIRIWTATDACGNSSSRMQVIDVFDSQAPILSGIPADVTVDLDNGGVIPGLPTVTATDNCDKNVDISFKVTTDTVLCDVKMIRTWTATDDCGNQTVKSQKITILKKCPCIEPIITDVKVTDASCGLNNGHVEISIGNGESNYDFVWFPNLGNSVGAGNIKTNLPAGTYSVIINYPKSNDCYKKLTIHIKDSGSDIIAEKEITVANHDCDKQVKVCLGIKPTDAVNFNITDNGNAYTGSIIGCANDTTMSYTYASIPGQGNSGPYTLQSWTVGGNVYSGDFTDIPALVALMNAKDPAGQWTQNTLALSIMGGKKGANYGQLKVKQTNGSGKATLDINTQIIPQGTALSLSNGDHQIIFKNKLSGCTDTVTVKVFCLNNDIQNITVLEGKSKKVCVDNSQLKGTPISITNVCGNLSGEFSTLSINQNDYCITVTGVEVGQEKACIVVCDNLGYCDTAFINISVISPTVSLKPIANDDYQNVVSGKMATIKVMGNDVYGENGADMFLISKPDKGTATVLGKEVITFESEKDQCEPTSFQYGICNQYGCDTATVYVNILCTDLVFNNAVSPNNDGLNDYFKIDGIDKYPNNKLTIFNRWGNKVYSVEKYQNNWDGKWNDKILPDGTYFYMFDDGNGTTHSGYIQILR